MNLWHCDTSTAKPWSQNEALKEVASAKPVVQQAFLKGNLFFFFSSEQWQIKDGFFAGIETCCSHALRCQYIVNQRQSAKIPRVSSWHLGRCRRSRLRLRWTNRSDQNSHRSRSRRQHQHRSRWKWKPKLQRLWQSQNRKLEFVQGAGAAAVLMIIVYCSLILCMHFL